MTTKIRRSKVQTRRLEAAIAMMEDIAKNKRDKFNMRHFKCYGTDKYVVDTRSCGDEKATPKFLSNCGTAACFAGWLTESEEYAKAMKRVRIYDSFYGTFFRFDISISGAPTFIDSAGNGLDTGHAVSKYFGICIYIQWTK